MSLEKKYRIRRVMKISSVVIDEVKNFKYLGLFI